MKRDVAMACQKVHEQGRIKVMVNIQSLFCSFGKDVGMDEALYSYHHFILPCLCTFWHAIPTSLFFCNDFSFLLYKQHHPRAVCL